MRTARGTREGRNDTASLSPRGRLLLTPVSGFYRGRGRERKAGGWEGETGIQRERARERGSGTAATSKGARSSSSSSLCIDFRALGAPRGRRPSTFFLSLPALLLQKPSFSKIIKLTSNCVVFTLSQPPPPYCAYSKDTQEAYVHTHCSEKVPWELFAYLTASDDDDERNQIAAVPRPPPPPLLPHYFAADNGCLVGLDTNRRYYDVLGPERNTSGRVRA